MYSNQLSLLNLKLETFNKLNNYLINLSIYERKNITFTTLKEKLQIDEVEAIEIKTKLENAGFINSYYALFCSECGLLVKKFNDIEEIVDDHCYNCESELIKDKEFIDVRYELNEDLFPILSKDEEALSQSTIRDFSLTNGNRNELLYHITEDERKELLIDLEYVINGPFNNTKEKGDALENFTIKLFNKIKCLNSFTFRTDTNQIDNMINNKLNKIIFEGTSKYILVECKNENKAPDVTYINKLNGIINTLNSKELFNTGFVVSKVKPTREFMKTSYVYISNESQIAIISITIDEIKELLVSNNNLIDFIENKIRDLYARKENAKKDKLS